MRIEPGELAAAAIEALGAPTAKSYDAAHRRLAEDGATQPFDRGGLGTLHHAHRMAARPLQQAEEIARGEAQAAEAVQSGDGLNAKGKRRALAKLRDEHAPKRDEATAPPDEAVPLSMCATWSCCAGSSPTSRSSRRPRTASPRGWR